MMLLLAMSALAQDPTDLREDLGGGAMVNWTTLTLEVTQTAQGRGVGSTRKATEASARTGLGDAVLSAAGDVHVDSQRDVRELVRDPVLGETVQARISRWSVGEARYYASGRIDVVAELSLLDLLKPYSLYVAIPRPEVLREPALTGVVIDARGTDAVPVWAPVVQAPNETVLWNGALWDDLAVSLSPVVWVSDPAHPAIVRAGQEPLVVRASTAGDGVLVLDALDAVRFRTALDDSNVLRSGAVVVVVDP